MHRRKAKRTPAGEAVFEIIVATAQAFFRLRAAGTRAGAVTPWGGGTWGLLRSLKSEGPQTVPQIARARPVARQRIQRLANEMAEAGLVEFIDNPAHRRSRLVRLTPKGEAVFEELTERIAGLSERLAEDMKVTDLRATAAVLKRLSEKLEHV